MLPISRVMAVSIWSSNRFVVSFAPAAHCTFFAWTANELTKYDSFGQVLMDWWPVRSETTLEELEAD